jgi:hypothetical protein
MKKRIFMMALLVSTLLTSAFANKTNGVNEKAVSSFRNEFKQAEEVKWEAGKDLAKVTFKLNDQVMFAYYSANGELVALTRNILSNQLPIHLMTSLSKNFEGYWISDLFEVSASENRSYYVTIENADYTLVLKSEDAGAWQLYKKTRKNID